MALKLISLNIEGSRHLNRILPFLKQERPDVVCLQEVFRQDLYHFKGWKTIHYQATVNVQRPFKDLPGNGLMGLVILTNLPARSIE